jgi:Cys-tRNA(Pro)/Cys-tRNA(Cys) deacylase
MIKNNITRLLEAKNFQFEAFVVPPIKLSAEETANILNIPVSIVFKTIILKPDKPGKPIAALIPADRIADQKKIAQATNEKKVHFPAPAEAEKLTGLQTGGITAIALINKGFRILLDQAAENLEWFHISGGQRGLNIKMKVHDFVKLTNAKIVDISKPIND